MSRRCLGLARQRFEAARRADPLELRLGVGWELAGQGLEVFLEELGVEADGRERVFDLVGQAAGKRAQLGEAARRRGASGRSSRREARRSALGERRATPGGSSARCPDRYRSRD